MSSWLTGQDCISGPCSHMASLLHDRAWHLQMARQIVFTDSCFWKNSWARLVMSMTESCQWVMQCHLRALRPWASHKGLRPCPLCTVISPVSLKLLMRLCTVDDDTCKAFAIWHWGTLFFKVFNNLFTRSFTYWRTSAHLYLWEFLSH